MKSEFAITRITLTGLLFLLLSRRALLNPAAPAGKKAASFAIDAKKSDKGPKVTL